MIWESFCPSNFTQTLTKVEDDCIPIHTCQTQSMACVIPDDTFHNYVDRLKGQTVIITGNLTILNTRFTVYSPINAGAANGIGKRAALSFAAFGYVILRIYMANEKTLNDPKCKCRNRRPGYRWSCKDCDRNC